MTCATARLIPADAPEDAAEDSGTGARRTLSSAQSPTPKRRYSSKLELAKQIQATKRWIERHGGSRAAYVERYGTADDPMRHGNGGEAIYEADMAELRRLEAEAAR